MDTVARPETVTLVNVPEFELIVDVVVIFVAERLLKFACPVTVRLFNVPTVVIPVSTPGASVPENVPPLISPVTVRLLSVPTELIFGCAALLLLRVPDNVVAVTIPVVDIFPVADRFDTVANPVTFNVPPTVSLPVLLRPANDD